MSTECKGGQGVFRIIRYKPINANAKYSSATITCSIGVVQYISDAN